jgi:1,4-dihydroxy-2-naphthoate octaprenyltransferase
MASDPMTVNPVSASARARPSTVKIWLQAVRVFSFTASAVPILVGSALALVDREFSWWLFLVMLAASVICHAGANLANDYFDHRKGVDKEDALGPSRVIQDGLLTPEQVRNGMYAAFAAATALGLVIVWRVGWPILLLALASLAAAYLYTGGPKPLGYVALGEVTVFVFMGLGMVVGAYYVHAERLTWDAAVASLGVAALVTAILQVNNIRDTESDGAAGKVTLATLFSRRFSNVEYVALIAGAYVAVLGLIALRPELWTVAVVGVSLPTALALSRAVVAATTPQALNLCLRKTAGLHLRFGALLTLGLLIRAAIDRF